MLRAQLTGWLRMRKLDIPCVSIGHPHVRSQVREGPIEPADQAVHARLWCRWTLSESLENGVILILTLRITMYKFVYNIRLCIAEGQYGH
jgi:hypothetical protein